MLVGKEDKSCVFASILLRFHLKTMKTLEKHNAEFTLIQSSDLTPSLNNVDTVLSCDSLRSVTDQNFKHFLKYEPSYSKSIEMREWHRLVLFSSVIFVHHIQHNNYCTPIFPKQLP